MVSQPISYGNEYRETKTDRRVIPQRLNNPRTDFYIVDVHGDIESGVVAKDCATNEDVFIPFSDFESLKYVKVSK